MEINGIEFEPSEIVSATIRRNGTDIYLEKPKRGQRVDGFSRAGQSPKPVAPGVVTLREDQFPPKR